MRFERRRDKTCGAAVLVAAALALAGCSSFSGGSSDTPLMSRFSSLFPGASAQANANAAAPGPTFNEDDCPGVEVRGGAGTLAVASRATDPTAISLRYQASFSQMARQCALVGSNLVMKVGVQGRIILGPAGESGPVDIPMRYAVVREGPEPKTITTKFKRFQVVVPSGESNVVFSDVEDNLSFPMPDQAQDIDAYVVYIGFDEMGDANEKKPVRKPAPKRK
jgi:hypothetical protein